MSIFPPEPLLISTLVTMEAVNAIHLRVFRKDRTARQASDSLAAFDADLAIGLFRVFPIPPSVWDLARRLSTQYSAILGNRSLDILQVAAAKILKADTFLTFDRNQTALAQAEGLQTPIAL